MTDFQGAHENLHLVERWTRVDADTIEYVVTIKDPTTWTRPWTVKQELKKQTDSANRIYYEPRCHERNYGLPGTSRRVTVKGRERQQAQKRVYRIETSSVVYVVSLPRES